MYGKKMRYRHGKKQTTIRLGLAGNPNAGKTTLFNAITGAHQKTGNYPGVTVEKKEGSVEFDGYRLVIYDLPGTYSLTAYSLDEIVARDFLLNDFPDVIINVLDSTNLERNLYLTMQLQEIGIPLICALNMSDEAQQQDILIDQMQLSQIIGIPMVSTNGRNEDGINDLLKKTIAVYEKGLITDHTCVTNYGFEIEKEIKTITDILSRDAAFSDQYPAHWFAVKLLEKDKQAGKLLKKHSFMTEVMDTVSSSIAWLEKHYGRDTEIVVSEQRYGYIHGALTETVTQPPLSTSSSDKADRVLLHRALGLPIFFVIVWLIFQATFVLGAYPMAWMEAGFSWLASSASTFLPDGFFRSLIVDGIIGGVGGMLVFLPNILILFLGIALLEDTGYMSRAAFIMDKVLHLFGLHGQSFIPLMAGFGCTVPAIMAARILKSPKDRLITILISPLISCGARLPVYALFIGAFFPEKMSGNVLFGIYFFGIMTALFMALIFRKVLLKGEASPFVMELPPYRMPTFNGILWHITNKTKSYIKKAGTIILAASIIIWLVTNFPKPSVSESVYSAHAQKMEEILNNTEPNLSNDERSVKVKRSIELQKRNDAVRASIAGRIGLFMEPVMRPLGFDWKISIALITGIAAKEIVVSTLGVLYRSSGDDASPESLRLSLQNDPNLDPKKALAFIIFVLLYVPCLSTLAVVRSELGTWKWSGFVFIYTIVIAWVMSFVVYSIAKMVL